jgi:hypothetical protein
MQARQGRRQPLVIARQAPESSHLGNGALHHPPARQEHKAPLGRRQFDHLHLHPGRGGRFARVALVDVSHFARVGPVIFIRRGDPQGQQVAQGVDGHVDLTAPAPFGPVVADPPAALAGALQSARAEHHRAGLRGVLFGQAQHGSQVVDQGLEDPGGNLPLGLLVHHGPGRKLMRDQAPRRPGANHPAQGVEDFAQGVAALAAIFAQQGEVRGDQGPFLIGNVTRARPAGGFGHPPIYPIGQLVPDRLHSPWGSYPSTYVICRHPRWRFSRLNPTLYRLGSPHATYRGCVRTGGCERDQPGSHTPSNITFVDDRLAWQKAQLSAKGSRKMRLFRLFCLGMCRLLPQKP